jgi:hypothetical protein
MVVMTINDGEVYFNGYLLGDNQNTFLDELTGWDDLPPVSSGNTSRPMYHGSFSGLKFAQERVITWTGSFNPANLSEWADRLRALRAATTLPTGTAEMQINIRTIDDELRCYGVVTNRSIPANRRYGAARLANVSIQFTCSDPRKYEVSDTVLSIPFPTTEVAGLVYPLTYPLDYGATPVGASGVFNNVGDAPSPVRFRITGPAVNPIITNATTGKFIKFNIVMVDGETLDIKTSDGSVIFNGTSDRLYTRDVTSSPILSMELAEGLNEIRVNATSWSVASGLTVTAPAGAYF